MTDREYSTDAVRIFYTSCNIAQLVGDILKISLSVLPIASSSTIKRIFMYSISMITRFMEFEILLNLEGENLAGVENRTEKCCTVALEIQYTEKFRCDIL